MSERKRASGSDWAKVDKHVITPEEYEEIPERTDEWFDQADFHIGGKLVRRGRPKSDTVKQQVTLRLDPHVVAALRASGAGWQTRVNDILAREVAKAAKKKPPKANTKRKRSTKPNNRAARGRTAA